MKQLLRGENRYWQKKPSNTCSSLEVLAWHAAADLAAFVELTLEPEDLPATMPDTWTILWGLEAYYRDIKELPSQSHALVLLLVERKS